MFQKKTKNPQILPFKEGLSFMALGMDAYTAL